MGDPLWISFAMSRSEIYAAWALLAALTLLVSLHWIVPIDDWVYRWVQFHRTCAVEHALHWIDPTVRGTLAALIGVAVVRRGCRRPWYLLGLVILFLAGAAATELLKTGIERLRPNSTPGTITGNSFPSGHTTGTTMVAIIAILLIQDGNWWPWLRWSAYTIAVFSVFLQGVGRLLTGSHWVSDVSVSMLLGSAWVLGASRLGRLPRIALGGLLAVSCIAFIVFDDVPGTRLRLPSAIDENRRWLVSIEFGIPESRPMRLGRWEDGPAEPIGPVSWALSSDVDVVLPGIAPPVGILKLAVRPGVAAEKRKTCARMVITVNEWVAPEIALARGWREYHVHPPAGAFRVGVNTIRFHIESDGEASGEDVTNGLAAFRYLRLYRGREAAPGEEPVRVIAPVADQPIAGASHPQNSSKYERVFVGICGRDAWRWTHRLGPDYSDGLLGRLRHQTKRGSRRAYAFGGVVAARIHQRGDPVGLHLVRGKRL